MTQGPCSLLNQHLGSSPDSNTPHLQNVPENLRSDCSEGSPDQPYLGYEVHRLGLSIYATMVNYLDPKMKTSSGFLRGKAQWWCTAAS